MLPGNTILGVLTSLSGVPSLLNRDRPTERKQIIRTWMSEMKLAPERLEVEMTYRIPEPEIGRAHV